MVELAELAVPTSHSQITSLGIHSLFPIQTALPKSQQDAGPPALAQQQGENRSPIRQRGHSSAQAAPERP